LTERGARRVGRAEASTSEPIVLLGGMFDPVHYGHLRFADGIRRALGVSNVRLVPAATPPHRAATRAGAADRVAMLDLAVREFPGLVVDTREIARGGRSYTFDTLQELRRAAATTPLVLLVGADAFTGFPTWHRWRELFDLAHMVVVPRPGADLEAGLPADLATELAARRTDDVRDLRARPAGSIYLQPMPPQPISSTQIRNAVAAREVETIDGLLPAPVLAYIGSHRLYQPPDGTHTHDPHAC
jgi:nicotinate-nucleotide adenylyltransferase